MGAHDKGETPVALVTGAARRLGAQIAARLHEDGWRVVIHYRSSRDEAEALAESLNARRPDSAIAIAIDLQAVSACDDLIDQASAVWSRLDGLVNNASSFYPTPLGQITEAHWDDLLGSNLKAPLFLAQAAAPHLHKTGGAIVNLADIHGLRALSGYAPYGVAKAGLVMLTRILARELGPAVRVNAVAPGHILPASHGGQSDGKEADAIAGIPLGRSGKAGDIAEAVAFLLSSQASYITGTVLPVDGGKLTR